MKHIYVVWHCKAMGQEPEAKLTQSGAQQANVLATLLMQKDIDFIVSSPYIRAYHSILPLANQKGIDVVLENRLIERALTSEKHSDWEAMLKKSFDDLTICYTGGESSYDAMQRAISVVKDVLNSQYHHIVVVSHGNLIALILKYFNQHIGFKEWKGLTNPDVYQLSFEADKLINLQRLWEADVT